MNKLLSALKSLAIGTGVLLGTVVVGIGAYVALSFDWGKVIAITGAVSILAYHIGESIRKP